MKDCVLGKDKPYNLRLNSGLRSQLDQLSAKNKESLNTHIEKRLEDSLFLEGAGVEKSLALLRELVEKHSEEDRPIPLTTLRLEQLLSDYNFHHENQINPSHLAYLLGYENASLVESFFSGKATPSFSQLKQLSDFFSCSERWLASGLGRPYSAISHDIDCSSFISVMDGLLQPSGTGKKMKGIIFVACPSPTDTAMIVRVFSDDSMQVYTLPLFNNSECDLCFGAAVLNVAYDAFRSSVFKYQTLAFPVTTGHFNALLSGHSHPSRILNDYINNQKSYLGKIGLEPLLDIKYPLAELYQINTSMPNKPYSRLQNDIKLLDANEHPIINFINTSENLEFNN